MLMASCAAVPVGMTAALTGAGTAVASSLAGTAAATRAAGAYAASSARQSPAGANLLGNAGAQTGAASAHGWDSVTIPGWQIVRGLPTVVQYGTRGYPTSSGPYPAGRGGQLFSGGTGGTAVLRQDVSLRAPGGGLLRAGTGFALSGWLGGTATSRASAEVTFLARSGKVLGHASIGPVGTVGTPRRRELARRAWSGALPAGTATAQVDLVLATSLRTFDGEDGPAVGYNRATADSLALSVTAAVRTPVPVRPPVAQVPRYQHVFLFYFENQDFGSLIGNRRQAPYLNRLLAKGSLLANLYAEEHPSDGNYLAVAGGSTFGIPLTDPLEENPLYTIRARNIADLIDAAHESWKGYLQSADGPCDDTVHRSYWNDDLPLLYFADIRDRPAYCAAHVVPLESLTSDLASTATTPSFAWIGPNDCTDMEGCGIHAGDEFLRTELGAIMSSPAWRTQRSLVIITVDEDAYNHPNPPQRIPTLILASSGVRRDYVSHVRYTHYSLLRTIEAALGLPSLTANDRYARPVNDVFAAGPAATASTSAAVARQDSTPRHDSAGHARSSRAASGRPANPGPVCPAPAPATPLARRWAFVANSGSGTVTPVSLATRKASAPVKVGSGPAAIVTAPDGRTIYVADAGSDTVTPVSTLTLKAGAPIPVGSDPRSLAITPDGRTIYVANSGSGTVTPICASTGLAGPPIAVGRYPRAIAVSPDGHVAYVLDWGSAEVTPITTADNLAGRPIPTGSYPFAIAFTPDGTRAYVANYGSDSVTPISVRAGTAGAPIPVGQAPDALAVSPDGATVEVVNGDSQTVTPITVATGLAGRAVRVGYAPADVAFSGTGGTAWVVNTISGTLTRIDAATGRTAKPVLVGLYGYPLVAAPDPAGTLAVVLDTYSGWIRLVSTASGSVVARLKVGSYATAVAFAG
jgi:YVTN family beta-propeller protein